MHEKQYTGTSDWDNKKIYEGDKINISMYDQSTGRRLSSAVVKVISQDGRFGVLWGNDKKFVCLSNFSRSFIAIKKQAKPFKAWRKYYE